MKRFFTFLILWLCTATLHAQLPVQIARQTVRTAVADSPSMLTQRTLMTIQSAGMPEMASAIEMEIMKQQLLRQQTAAPVVPETPLPAQATTRTAQHAWPVQKFRDYKAAQLKKQRRKRDAKNQQDRQALEQAAALRARLPQLDPARAFETQDFTPLITDQISTQQLPLLERPGVLYRGMALEDDGSSVQNILQNGLRLQDLGSHATTKLLAMSGGMRGTVSATRPVTNLTSIPSEALYWATQRIESGKPLLVIMAVTGQHQSGKVVLLSQDIPADQISHVVVPLQVEGKPTWCNVQLTDAGTFLVTPYQPVTPRITPEK